MILAERIRAKVAATSVSIGERQVAMSVSIGIAPMSSTDPSSGQVLAHAEAALGRAKAQGRNRVEVAVTDLDGILPAAS